MKVEINKKLIEHVAKIARLELTEDEKENFSSQIKDIIEVFS